MLASGASKVPLAAGVELDKLSDAQLGLLSGIVAVMVGILTFPLSLAADRWGRREKVTIENAVNAEVDLILARLEAALPPEWFEVALRAITGGGASRGEAGDADGVPRLPDAADPVH